MMQSNSRFRQHDRLKWIAIRRFVFLVLPITSYGQTVESGWKGILPLVSGKADVEKAFGKPERVDDNGYYNYLMEDSFVQVNYAIEPCRPNQYDRGKFNVAKDTVLDVWVYLKKAIFLKDLNFDRPRYVRDTSGHTGGIYYINRDMSVMISAGTQDAEGSEYVGRIEYRPAKKLEAKIICN